MQVEVAEGRRFVHGDADRYDLITLALVETSPAVLRGRSHVHARLLTVEAITGYLDHLKADGAIAIVHNAPDLAGRSVATALAALAERGQSTTRQLVSISLPGVSPLENPFSHLLLISNRPWRADEVRQLQLGARALGASLDALSERHEPHPPSDERPFFFSRSRGPPWHTWLAVLALLAAVALAARRPRVVDTTRPRRLDAALVLSGAAAALIQVAAIYRAQVAVGAPAVAMGGAIGGLLAGAGLTALFWPRLPAPVRRPAVGCALAAGSAVFLWATSGAWSTALWQTQPAVAALITAATLVLHGLPLGLPFVALLGMAADAGEDGEAVAVAQDALGAVAGATCATAVAVTVGFGALFAVAATLLGLAAWLLSGPPSSRGVRLGGPAQTEPHGHEGPADHQQPGERHGDAGDRHQPEPGVQPMDDQRRQHMSQGGDPTDHDQRAADDGMQACQHEQVSQHKPDHADAENVLVKDVEDPDPLAL